MPTLGAMGVIFAIGCGSETPPPEAQPDSAPDAGAAVVVIGIEGEGLRTFLVATGATRSLSFGIDSAVVHETILRTRPGNSDDAGSGGECPGSYVRWSNGLTVRYREGKFVGWSLQGGDGSITTVSGIGIGTTREYAESVVNLQVSSTSLGTEFTAGALAGRFDGPGATAKVTDLWAGETCIAR